jgi:hypothetical protein
MADNRLPKQGIWWKPPSRKKKENPTLTWIDSIKRVMKEQNLQEGQQMNREEWCLGIIKRQ